MAIMMKYDYPTRVPRSGCVCLARIFFNDTSCIFAISESHAYRSDLPSPCPMKSTEIQLANSKAICLWAKVHPPLPDLETIPMASVASIHFCGDMRKLLLHVSATNWSNSTSLKFGLYNDSQVPRKTSVLWLRIQFFTISAGDSGFLRLAISVRQI